uniref:B-4DMT family transporter n=1 Tax=Nocardia wallacei TaxID=480035 RepID=UPI0024539C8E
IYWPPQGGGRRILCGSVLTAAVGAGGLLDGRGDRRANPDPERGGADLTMLWLKAGIAGGLGAGVVAWVLDFLPRFDLGDNGLGFELTAGASFIILLIFVPGMVGVALGRFLVGRETKKAEPAPPPTAASAL